MFSCRVTFRGVDDYRLLLPDYLNILEFGYN